MPSARSSEKPARKRASRRKTIRWSEWQRLSFSNSPRLPGRVWIGEQLYEWVGIGWIPLDDEDATGSEPTVID